MGSRWQGGGGGGRADLGQVVSHERHVTPQAARSDRVALRTWIVVPGLGEAGMGFLVSSIKGNVGLKDDSD